MKNPDSGNQVSEEFENYLRYLFNFQTLSINQVVVAIAQRYVALDEHNYPRFYVRRPRYYLLNFLARLAGFVIFLPFLVVAVRILFNDGPFGLAIATFILGTILSRIVALILAPYRDIEIYTDESEQFRALYITQDNKVGFFRRYTLYDPLNNTVAIFRRNTVVSIFRRSWEVMTPDGRQICLLKEDSLGLSLLRRYLGPLLGLLRTNFDFYIGNDRKTKVGEFNRKFTLRDRYLLDLRWDTAKLIDRRVALASAILLDTAEGR